MDFGSRIRELRKQKYITQRKLAERVGMDFTYLSKIESGKVEPPSEDKIRGLAKQLDADPDELIALAGRMSSEQIRKVVEANPDVGVLLRKIQKRELTREQIARMLKIAQDQDKGK